MPRTSRYVLHLSHAAESHRWVQTISVVDLPAWDPLCVAERYEFTYGVICLKVMRDIAFRSAVNRKIGRKLVGNHVAYLVSVLVLLGHAPHRLFRGVRICY